MSILVGEQVVEVVCNGFVVACLDEEARLVVLNLERDAASAGGNDGYALVQCLADFDFEPFARRQLESDMGASHQDVKDLIRGPKTHDDDVVLEVVVLVTLQSSYRLIIDDGRVGIVNCTVSSNDKLGNILELGILHVDFAKLVVRGEHIRNALCWVKACDLNNVRAIREVEFTLDGAHALRSKHMHVVLSVPIGHSLVQTIKPIRTSRQVAYLLRGNIIGDKFADRMADEDITSLDTVPHPIPDVGGRGTLLVSKVGADLDMATEDDRTGWIPFFGNLDKTRHLRIVDDDNVGATLVASREGPAILCPVSFSLVFDPLVELFNIAFREALGNIRLYALEDVVVVFGDTKDASPRIGHIPDTCESGRDGEKRLKTYHLQLTSMSRINRIKACLISATPPPCGVLLKKAIFTLFFLSECA